MQKFAVIIACFAGFAVPVGAAFLLSSAHTVETADAKKPASERGLACQLETKANTSDKKSESDTKPTKVVASKASSKRTKRSSSRSKVSTSANRRSTSSTGGRWKITKQEMPTISGTPYVSSKSPGKLMYFYTDS